MVENGLYKTPFNAGKVLLEAAPSIDTGSMIFSGTDVGLFWQAFHFLRSDILFFIQDTFEFTLFRSHLVIAIIKTALLKKLKFPRICEEDTTVLK